MNYPIILARNLTKNPRKAYFLHRVLPKTRRVPQEAVLRTEYLLRTREGGFRYRISLPYQKSLFFTPNAPENASRTTGDCFLHRAHIPYHRRPSPVPNATKPERGKSLLTPNPSNCQKRRDQCKKRSPGCRREQENHSQKVCNTAPNLLNTSRKS